MGNSFYVTFILIAALVLWRRTRSFYRPIKGDGRRILLPVLFMLPGIALVLNKDVHAPAYEWLVACAIGVALSIPLIWTTEYEVREDKQIYAKKNVGFIVAFVAVLAIRFALRSYLQMIDPQTLSALFMVVAFSYVLPWRIVSFVKFRRTALLQSA
ncbi:CcdC family protein [Cohnella faecalis]|uniref:Cytochrome c biogenesis protein CcdC n=1 Tax=Cohnella faecalis TaxID=2315694 RepID=A0A398CLW4_9BACL|nr:cytochrome c biogenesis protein CcdC [Cohnella faecalis]RIE02209.1 cytochrome c biogenesis protein CcdC [Cohnella faecalis]